MGKSSGFDYTIGGDKIPINKPYIDIFTRIMDAESADDPNALNNLMWTAQTLATMTLAKKDGDVVRDLLELSLRVERLIQQHAELEIGAMSTHDDDKIDMIRENARMISAITTRRVSRHILNILCYSFVNGPMSGCGVDVPSGLAFVPADEFDAACGFVESDLASYGLFDVIDALEENTEMCPPETAPPRRRFGAVRQPME